MFEDVAQKLLSGQVVCKYTQRGLFDKLENDDINKAICAWLSKVGMRLEKTASGTGYYAVYNGIHSEVKQRAREFFKVIARDLRFTLEWLELITETMNNGTVISSGETIRYDQVLSEVSENINQQQNLYRITRQIKGPVVNGEQLRSHVEKLFNKLVAEGVLTCINKSSEIYQFTSKVELIQDYIVFIKEVEEIPDIETYAPEYHQESLF